MDRPVTIIQITDTHLRGDDSLQHGYVDTAQQLERILETVRFAGTNVDALIVSGDASDDGSATSYAVLQSLLRPVAAELNATLIQVPGNHDSVEEYAAAVGATDGFDRVFDVGDLRVVTLDSTRGTRHDGCLSTSQLAWLEQALASPPPFGAIVVVHHPPIGSPIRTVHALRLKNGPAFADVLSRHRVRLVLSGHTHYTGGGSIGGAAVWLGTPASYTLNAWPLAGEQSAVDRYGFSRIDIDAHTASAIAVPVGVLQAVYRRRTDEYDELLTPYLEDPDPCSST